MTYDQRKMTHLFIKKILSLPLLPVSHILPTFQNLKSSVTTPWLNELLTYLDITWLNNGILSVQRWSVFRQSIHTNNDTEGNRSDSGINETQARHNMGEEKTGLHGSDWKLDDPDWTGRLRVVAKGKELTIKLEDKNSGWKFVKSELFAECPVDAYPGVAVESVIDSSRYFVLRIKDGTDGVLSLVLVLETEGSFDLNVALQDHFKWLRQEEEAQKRQTITLNIGTKKSTDSPSKSRPKPQASGSGGIGFLPPPPGGVKFTAPPAASTVQSEALGNSSVKNQDSGASSGVDLLFDLQPSSNEASRQPVQNPPDLWGDFTGASSENNTSTGNGTNSTNWVQF
ncbi:hypothetical protein ScPMuIL_007935 [Solemya velum]